MKQATSLFAIICFTCASHAQVTLPYFTDFSEADGFLLGSLDGQDGWTVTEGSANVVEVDLERLVEIAGGSPVSEIAKAFASTTGPDVTFAELRLKPVAASVLGDSTLVDLGEARMRFLRDGSLAEVYAWDGLREAWVSTGASFSVSLDGKAVDFLPLTVRIDYEYGIFDFYFEGQLYEIEFGQARPASYFSSFGISGHGAEKTLFDDPFADFSNPMFDDLALDGINDDWKLKHDLPLDQNVRYIDYDGDGLLTIEEYLLGKLPLVADHDSTGLTGFYYANNQVGRDSYDGKSATVVPKHGPKASISAAMGAAQSGDVVVVLSGTTAYQEGVIAPQGKRLTIRPVGQVVVR